MAESVQSDMQMFYEEECVQSLPSWILEFFNLTVRKPVHGYGREVASATLKSSLVWPTALDRTENVEIDFFAHASMPSSSPLPLVKTEHDVYKVKSLSPTNINQMLFPAEDRSHIRPSTHPPSPEKDTANEEPHFEQYIVGEITLSNSSPSIIKKLTQLEKDLHISMMLCSTTCATQAVVLGLVVTTNADHVSILKKELANNAHLYPNVLALALKGRIYHVRAPFSMSKKLGIMMEKLDEVLQNVEQLQQSHAERDNMSSQQELQHELQLQLELERERTRQQELKQEELKLQLELERERTSQQLARDQEKTKQLMIEFEMTKMKLEQQQETKK
jgi:hypothetical protein